MSASRRRPVPGQQRSAQGLTVDSAIVLVDERTTAESLDVGMTRGRDSNVALAVCDEPDAEHAAGPTRRPSEVLVAALGRSTAEVAALESLREALSRSESLTTLRPRLANLDAWIAKETPPDRSRELQWAADGLDNARRYCRPGHLTRTGRDDRRRLEAAEARYDAVAAKQGQRQAWLEAHADTLAYREELAEAVTKRRRELGVAATITQPDHVVDLIGAMSTDSPAALQRWMNTARRIEAYREEWGVAPEQCESDLWTPARPGTGTWRFTCRRCSPGHRCPLGYRALTTASAWSCNAHRPHRLRSRRAGDLAARPFRVCADQGARRRHS